MQMTPIEIFEEDIRNNKREILWLLKFDVMLLSPFIVCFVIGGY